MRFPVGGSYHVLGNYPLTRSDEPLDLDAHVWKRCPPNIVVLGNRLLAVHDRPGGHDVVHDVGGECGKRPLGIVCAFGGKVLTRNTDVQLLGPRQFRFRTIFLLHLSPPSSIGGLTYSLQIFAREIFPVSSQMALEPRNDGTLSLFPAHVAGGEKTG